MTIISDNCPPLHPPRGCIRGCKNPRIIVGENYCHFGSSGCAISNSLRPQNQEGKNNLNIKFLGGKTRGRPGGYLGGRPGPKTFTPSLGTQENKVSCADVLDPKVRMSMTREGLRKTLCRKVRAYIFRSLQNC